MPTTTSPLTPTTHELRAAASFNLRSDILWPAIDPNLKA